MTCGVKHVMFWSLAGGQLVGKRGVLTRPEGDDSETTLKMQTMLSVAFGAVGIIDLFDNYVTWPRSHTLVRH